MDETTYFAHDTFIDYETDEADDRPTPRLDALMNDPDDIWADIPPIPVTEIVVSVRRANGDVIEVKQTESDMLWDAYYPYVRGHVIRQTAEKVCEELERQERMGG